MKKALSLPVYLVLFLFSTPLIAQGVYPILDESIDQVLQAGLQASLEEMGLHQPAEKKQLALTLVDITDLENPRMAAINGNQMMYAASLPKIAILLGAFERIERGTMPLDTENRTLMTRMIRNSSNKAATTMLQKVGNSYLAELLQSPRYQLYDHGRNGGLWVGKEYGKAGAWKRDPLHNLSHGATALQVARYYYLLETNRLVSPELTRDMKEMLGDPAINHKFVKGLKEAHPDADIYRKSGTWRQYHSDSALVERNGRRYIAVGLAQNELGGQWLSRIIVEMDRLIFSSQTLARGVSGSGDAGV